MSQAQLAVKKMNEMTKRLSVKVGVIKYSFNSFVLERA